jgi:hypothetical protein
VTAATFGFHFRIQCADAVFAWLEKCCRFFVPPPPQPVGDVVATAEASPINFEAMAAEQNRCPETQYLLSSSSLTIAFRQAGAHRLVCDVSTGFF